MDRGKVVDACHMLGRWWACWLRGKFATLIKPNWALHASTNMSVCLASSSRNPLLHQLPAITAKVMSFMAASASSPGQNEHSLKYWVFNKVLKDVTYFEVCLTKIWTQKIVLVLIKHDKAQKNVCHVRLHQETPCSLGKCSFCLRVDADRSPCGGSGMKMLSWAAAAAAL